MIVCTLHLLLTPCYPGNFGYFLLAPCRDSTQEWSFLSHGILHMIFTTLTFTFYLPLVPAVMMEAIVYASLHCLCLANYHLLLFRNIQKHWNISRTVQMFKEVQLLTTNYNLIHGYILSLTLTLSMTSSLITSGYAVLGIPSEINLAQLLDFGAVMVDCILGILICDGCFKANVHIFSESVLGKIKAGWGLTRRRIMKRYIVSWPSAKIKLGSTNFYDKETPLNLINFCFTQIVNLLLL